MPSLWLISHLIWTLKTFTHLAQLFLNHDPSSSIFLDVFVVQQFAATHQKESPFLVSFLKFINFKTIRKKII